MATLVLGYRKAFMKALVDRSEVYLWVDDPKFRKKTWMPKSWKLLKIPFPRTLRDADKISWNVHGQPHEIFATTESTVVIGHLLKTYFKRGSNFRDAFRWAMTLHDKYFMKHHARKQGIRTIPWVWSANTEKRDWFLNQLSPSTMLVLKDRRESGSKNLKVILRHEYVPQKNQLIEIYLDAREFSVETFCQNGSLVLKNITEYRIKKHLNVVPAPLDSEISKKIYDFNEKILKAFEITGGLTHVEMYLDGRGNLYFGEIAYRPPGGYIMDLLQMAYNMNPWKLWIDVMDANPPSLPQKSLHTAAAWVIHPGHGKVRHIRGVGKVQQMPECVRLRVSKEEGDTLKKRKRLSEEFGHLILKAPNHDALNLCVDKALRTLQIDME